MIGKAAILVPVVALAGFFAGYVAPRGRDLPPAPDDNEVRGASPPVAAVPSPAPSRLKSADTRDTLAALADHDLYPRLALWLLDAPVEEIAAFWDGYRQRPQPDQGVIRLIFSQWTRTNPHAAIAAAKGAGEEGNAWWAWASHDPHAAVAAVREASAEMAAYVMNAIGLFHPKIALRILKENPGFGQWGDGGARGVANGIARTDPEAALELLRRHGVDDDGRLMKDLTRRDPRAAFAWLLDHRGEKSSRDAFVGTLERENPELLEEMAAAAPSGSLKWQLDAAAFKHLAATDPERAQEMAKNSSSPKLAAARYAALGRQVVGSDPERALGLFRELLAACPGKTAFFETTGRPGGADTRMEVVEGVKEFISDLTRSEPEAAMTAAEEAGDKLVARDVANVWAAQDLDGFSRWVAAQPAGYARDQNSSVLIQHLLGERSFREAMQWSTGTFGNAARGSQLGHVFDRWFRYDRDAALNWLDQDATDEVRQALQPYTQR